MLNAHSIPYNPSARAVGVFATFGIVLGMLNRFAWFQSRLWFGAAIGFIGRRCAPAARLPEESF
jgi:hypothetical protein